MNNIKHALFLLPLLSMIFFSCVREPSDSVSQDSIYGEYRLVYEAGEDKSYARAEFHFGSALGTKLELSDPATVSAGGGELSWKPLLAYYEKDFAGVEEELTFTYTDIDGNTFSNTVSQTDPIAFPASLDPIEKGAAYTLSWVGNPVGPSETITVTVNGPNEGDAKIFTTTDPGATSIILGVDKLGDLGLGTGRIVMERRKDAPIQEGTSKGGAIWVRYVTATEEIQINE